MRETKEIYGIGEDATDAFGRKCLLARKLVEKGVRFVQLYNGTWDSHDYIERAHGNLVRGVDQPIAALIADLKQRGLLDSTLIVWCGEFGRTPDNGVRGGTAYGRDHNPKAMTIWLAGGGCKAGHTIGATDELGMDGRRGQGARPRFPRHAAAPARPRRQQADLLPRRPLQAAQPVRRAADQGSDRVKRPSIHPLPGAYEQPLNSSLSTWRIAHSPATHALARGRRASVTCEAFTGSARTPDLH